MKKDSTVNTFQHGIIQDVDQSQLNLTCLYNCLNGTYITKDGDLYALLNDMGNARVQLIKLPSGYVPVGLCDHGGITYIASYNPIENKGLIGSFPAPQENVFLSNGNNIEGLSITFSNNGALQFSKLLFNSDLIIRPGDKFSLYVPEDSILMNPKLISGVTGEVDLCPKKRAISVAVCVLDSNGNLHDITNTLERFEYNTGNIYFNSIFKQYEKTSESEVDANNLVPNNIYNCKITGPLYLVYTLNGIISTDIAILLFKGPLDNISLFITLKEDPVVYKIEVGENELCALFDVTYKYNCPDNFYALDHPKFLRLSDSNPVKQLLLNTYGNKSTYKPELIIRGILCEHNDKKCILPFNIKGYSLAIPTLDNNIYSSRQRYLLNNIDIENIKNITFNLTPSLIYCTLKNLASSLSVNVEKLNSGDVSINQWRYFVDNNGVTLTWGLDTYPFVGTRLSNVRLEFYNLLNPNTTINSALTLSKNSRLDNKFYYSESHDRYVDLSSKDILYTIKDLKIENNLMSFNFSTNIPLSIILEEDHEYTQFGQGGYDPNSLFIEDIRFIPMNNYTQIEIGKLEFNIITDNNDLEDTFCINSIESSIQDIVFTSNELLLTEEYTVSNPQIKVDTSFPLGEETLTISGTFSIEIKGKYGNYFGREYVLPIEERSSYFGTFTNTISTLSNKSVYCILLKYQLANELNMVYDTVYTAGVRTMFTTPLLNDLYTTVQDYNNLPPELYTKYYTYDIQSSIDLNVISKLETLINKANIIYANKDEGTINVELVGTHCQLQGKLEINTTTEEYKYPFSVTIEDISIDKTIPGETTSNMKVEGTLELDREEAQYYINDFTIDEDLNIKISGDGYSIYKGKLKQGNINFTNPIVEYFPIFKTSGSTNYIKEKLYQLFGYDDDTSSKHRSDAYKIAYGITYRGLSGHLDHHGVKYIEVYRGQTNETIYSDLHSSIYGTHWYDGEDEVFKCGDNAKTFYLYDFLNNPNVVNKYKGVDFIYLDSEGTANENIDEHDKGHYGTEDEVGDTNYTSDNIDDFVYCDRKDAEWPDRRIMKKGWYKMLLWRNNDTWILIKNSKSGFVVNEPVSSPDLFTKAFNNIYIKRDTTISKSVYMYNTADYLYIPSYNMSKSEEVTYIIHYNINEYNTRISNVLKLLNLDKDSTNTVLKYSIFNNIKDNDFNTQTEVFNNTFEHLSKKDIDISFKINGTEDVYQDVKALSASLSYTKPTIITLDYKVYFRDYKELPLLENQVYEINNNTVLKFGTNTTNSILSRYIVIEDGIIYPNSRMYSNKYLNTILTLYIKSGTDCDTILKLGKINCLEIPLT